MSASAFTILFLCFLAMTFIARCYLAVRQIRSVVAHKNTVPEQFASTISLAAHQKAGDYTVTKLRFGFVSLAVDTLVLLCFTLGGGIQIISNYLSRLLGTGLLFQIILGITIFAISGLISIPFDYYHQFVIEERFGFNKMTPRLFFSDLVKSTLIGLLIGLPLIWILLIVMSQLGDFWWFYAWILWCAFQFLMLFIYPTFIAPLFNKFQPLEDDALKARIESLMQRTGFKSKGLFIMDGSKRSAHGNAYFTGMGSAKRVVFFDTLIKQLSPEEIEAVLGHELGHFKLRHITKRIIVSFLISLGFLALLGWLKTQPWFYAGLGTDASNATDMTALILFGLTLPAFTFFLSPIMAISSRKHEFEADAFSAQYTEARHLISALVKMYEDNASTLTPDAWYSAFYDSHPPASIRIAHLTDLDKHERPA